MAQNRFYEYTLSFLDQSPGRTIEMQMLDKRMIITDNPENIKAMLHSQVCQLMWRTMKHANCA